MKAYSLDLRTRVLAAIDGGMSRADAVCTFHVSLGSIKRWLHLRQTSGTLASRPRTGARKHYHSIALHAALPT